MWKNNLLRKLSVLTLGGGLLLSAACVPTPPTVPGGPGGGTSAVGKPRVPATGLLFGLWENPGEGNFGEVGEKALWNKRETQIARKADIGNQFYTFGTSFPTWRETWHIQNGRTPMISWNGTYASEVNTGQHDALIRSRANAVKNLNAPVLLRYFWEPDAAKKEARAGTPATYIANWRRVHKIFQAQGATNAAFVWCPTAWGFANGEAQTFYPGDAYVDWICADGYNWGQTQAGDKWRDWKTIYDPFYKFGMAHNKPMIAGEYGSVERYAGEKAQWFRTARQQLKTMPGIKAIVYFDSRRQEAGVWRDWRIDTSTTSLTAFREMAQDPYFNTRNR